MPYVNMQIADSGLTGEHREALIKGVTDLIVDVLGRDPGSVFVVLDAVPLENYGVGGRSLAQRRAQESGNAVP